jgi:hypothetical protein
MSMNFSEFKKLIGADPWNRDPETLQALNSAPEFAQAAREAEDFEHKLQNALRIQPPADLLADIKGIARQPVPHRHWLPLALAASLLIAVSAMVVVWNQPPRQDVRTYLADHYALDGDSLLAGATDTVPEQDINRIMASLNVSAGPQLSGVIRFIKFCPTPEGRGAHMVVSTEQGLMTIIFMPDTQVVDGELVQFGPMQAYLVNFDFGSAAIIGTSTQAVENLEPVVRSSISTRQVNA